MMKLFLATTSIAAIVFPRNIAAYYWVCDPSLPCGPGQEIFSCPCGPSGTSVCGYEVDRRTSSDYLYCCGTSTSGVGYAPCWANPYPWYDCQGGASTGPLPCCGFNAGYSGASPPCGSSSFGKSGKSTSLTSSTATCNGINQPLCCGFENYPPCENQQPCGFGEFPPCPSNLSGKSGKGYELGYFTTTGTGFQLTGSGISPLPFDGSTDHSGGSGRHGSQQPFRGEHTSTSKLTMEQLLAEVDGAVEEAVDHMVNIGEMNVYEGEVNVYKYADDGEGDVVNIVTSEGLN